MSLTITNPNPASLASRPRPLAPPTPPPTVAMNAAFPAPPAHLFSAVALTYERALSSKSLIFTSAASVSELTFAGVTYRVHFCPSLLNKPQPTQAESIKAKSNPFLPPSPELLVAANTLGGDYNLVLNKYPIIPCHFIVSTVAFEYQNEPLRRGDIAAVYACLRTWDEGRGRLYAFFNSGHESGASQPHRHVQFIPLPEGRRIFGDDAPEGREDVWTHPGVPFKTFLVRLGEDLTPEKLYRHYQILLEKCREALGVREGAEDEWSYNLGMTREWIMLAPRTKDNGGKEGLSINGTVLAGETMVKRPEDLEFYKSGGLTEVLRGIGVPNPSEAKL